MIAELLNKIVKLNSAKVNCKVGISSHFHFSKILKLGQVRQCLGVHLTDTGTQIFAGNFVDHVNNFLFLQKFFKNMQKKLSS